MSGLREHEARIDRELIAIFGLTAEEIEDNLALKSYMPMPMFLRIEKALEDGGVFDLVDGWMVNRLKSPVGRKQQVSARAIIMALTLNMFWGLGGSVTLLGDTLKIRLTSEQRTHLGITVHGGNRTDWYNRAWRALNRVLTPVDPWYMADKRRKYKVEEFTRLIQLTDKKRKKRSHGLMAAIVSASVNILPEKFWDGYRGDVALDATFIETKGKKNFKGYDNRNADFCGGQYSPRGNHFGDGRPDNLYGHELETTVAVDVTNGNWMFGLITGASLHRPGRISRAGRRAMKQHIKFSPKPGTVVTDRAYTSLKPENFQEHVCRAGYWSTYDYPVTNRGFQHHIPEHRAIQVDGTLYVEYMPEQLQNFTKRWAKREPNPDTGKPYTYEELRILLEKRTAYEIKPHGRPNENLTQRFTYPAPSSYVGVDAATGRSPKRKPKGKFTITLTPPLLKNMQHHPWGSPRWRREAGQRNHVENSNKMIKEPGGTDLGNSAKRPSRGFAYQNLAIALGVFGENIRRIVAGIKKFFAPAKPATADTRTPEEIEKQFWDARYRIPGSIRRKMTRARSSG